MPFGEELGAGVGPRTTNLKYSTTSVDNVRQRFTGYEKDEETDLDFAEARMYQAKHGRFTAVDPLLASASAGDPQTFNRYTYTGNNPINYTDLLGLKWCRDPSGGAVSWANGNCPDGQKVIDGTVGQTENTGCAIGITTSCYTAGSVIGYNRDGTTSLVRGGRQLDPYNEKDAAQIAKISGTEVQAEQNETAVSNASEIVSPMATLISLRPLENMTRQEFETGADNVQIGLGTCGLVLDLCDLADGMSEKTILEGLYRYRPQFQSSA